MASRVTIACGVAAAALAMSGAAGTRRTVPAQAPCTFARVSQWSSIRDSLWPALVHRDGDELWAHLDTASLPAASATWCNPLANDAAALSAGRALYAEKECATCHGERGAGDGPGGGVMEPPPYDFTRREFAGMREAPGPALLYAIVARGITGTTMPPHPMLSGWERLAIIAYVTSLPGPDAVRASRAWADSLRRRRP